MALSTRLSSTTTVLSQPLLMHLTATWWSRHFTLLVFAVFDWRSLLGVRIGRSSTSRLQPAHAFKQHTDQIATRKKGKENE
jgi:hypothetical protein